MNHGHCHLRKELFTLDKSCSRRMLIGEAKIVAINYNYARKLPLRVSRAPPVQRTLRRPIYHLYQNKLRNRINYTKRFFLSHSLRLHRAPTKVNARMHLRFQFINVDDRRITYKSTTNFIQAPKVNENFPFLIGVSAFLRNAGRLDLDGVRL